MLQISSEQLEDSVLWLVADNSLYSATSCQLIDKLNMCDNCKINWENGSQWEGSVTKFHTKLKLM